LKRKFAVKLNPIVKGNDSDRTEIRVTVDGAGFYAFARAIKRGFRADDLGEMVFTLGDGKLVIETKRGGCVLACESEFHLSAQATAKAFRGMISLTADSQAAGPLTITFRPKFGEIALPHTSMKAKFDVAG
jgi:hypothetical protein